MLTSEYGMLVTVLYMELVKLAESVVAPPVQVSEGVVAADA